MPRRLPNWLKAYLAYTAKTESPESFHLWCGLSALAGAVRRRVFMDRGYFILFPNLYVVLAAPAGRCRKSTAIRLSRELLEPIQGVKLSADSQSRERLAQDMQVAYVDGHSSLTAYSSELGSFFATSAMDMVIFLTDVYDCPPTWTHKTKTAGSTKINAPYLNMLAGTTPDWMATAMPFETVGIGFTSRAIFVYEDTPRARRANPKLSPEEKALKALLAKDLAHIAALDGEYKYGPKAEEFYEAWYDGQPNEPRDTRLAGYFERKHAHVLKLSMLLAAAESDTLLIQVSHIQDAVGILSELEPGMDRVFSAVGKNPLSADIEHIGTTILRHPEGIAFSTLLEAYKYSVSKDQLAEVMDTLVTIGYAKVYARGVDSIYFPKFVSDADIKNAITAVHSRGGFRQAPGPGTRE